MKDQTTTPNYAGFLITVILIVAGTIAIFGPLTFIIGPFVFPFLYFLRPVFGISSRLNWPLDRR
jgi:hypothetical protein